MLPASSSVVGVDFGAPRRARDQRRKIIAIAAQAIAEATCRMAVDDDTFVGSEGAIWVPRTVCRS
jgi:hypothetical protein